MRSHSRKLSLPLAQVSLAAAFFGQPLDARAAEDVPPAYATCAREPSDADESAAKGAFEAGQVSFQEADYYRAILYWEDAFRRDCTAAPLLLNLARAYELSGEKRHAVLALETFLERRPDASDRASIEKRIAAMKSQFEQEARPTPAPVEPRETEPKETPAAAASGEPAPETADSSSPKPWWPIAVTGAGVAIGVGGVVMSIIGSGQINDFYDTSPFFQAGPNGEKPICAAETKTCDTTAATAAVNANEDLKSGTSTRNLGYVGIGVGSAIAVAGGVLWALTWSGGDEEGESGTLEKSGTARKLTR